MAIARKTILGYAVGSLGTGVYLTVPSVLLLFFMTDTLGISAALAGVAIVAPKVLGAVLDPIVGWLSDRTRSRWGRRRPWMLVGALGLGCTFMVLFHVPDFATADARFLYVLLVFLASAVCYSLFATPYIAMPAEMSPQSQERTRIMAWRMTMVLTGVIIGSAVAPMLVSAFGGGRQGYGVMSLFIGAACVAAMLTSVVATRSPSSAGTETGGVERAPFTSTLLGVVRNPAFVRLSAVFLVQTSIFGLTGALLPYVVSRILGGDEALVGALLLALLVTAIACMGFWAWASKRWGHCRCLIGASIGHAVVSLTLFEIGPGYPLPLVFLQFALVGIFYAALLLLPFAMLTDVIAKDQLESHAREGAYTGVWTAVEKIGLATGPALAALLLSLSDYNPGDGADAPALDMIRWAIAFGPAAAQALAVMLLFGYPALHSERRAAA
ncbi:MFS transporter [Sphingosinicella soli]|uniref:Na+/melibiose symporter-like transporter n=1 Tax=Sphingosinicella soli TaxID=333708 RepID=A0A7W7F815_9SPHN|nr:MFS transporter [Sphingosinicella soli]MBB4633259.1 Na+/melibiose symporter-like transporter [Sphingosinicella soli]